MSVQYLKYDNNPDLQSSILTEDSFLYAHLIKFEKVPESTSGLIAEEASDYSYVTDGSFNISFDDGSKSIAGVANGAQTYVAGRLVSVGNITDTTEAKVSNVSLTMSSISLGSKFVAASGNTITVNPVTGGATLQLNNKTETDDWVALGFGEGDTISLTSSVANDQNHNLKLTISSFEDDNYRAVCIFPSKTPVLVNNSQVLTVNYETDEVTAVLDDPSNTTYNNYINREVSIYKAHINPTTGTIIGSPYLLFKGIISKAKITDDPNKNSVVNWTLTSHWGDFIRVNGRQTVDSAHRAIGGDGKPDLGALFRDDYAFDYGFAHGDQAINIIAVYQVQETRYKLKSSGFLGLKKKLKEYEVTVDRDVDLRLNLEAKYLPVVYGVQRTDSIPVFADSLANDPKKIYVVYAICEGEVSGIYDIYVDDQSRICIDKNDSDTRSTQTGEETIDVICEGRMDRGDTLSSAVSARNELQRGMARGPSGYDQYTGGMFSGISNWLNYNYHLENLVAAETGIGSATGVTHEKQTSLRFPLNTRLIFHAGRSHQRADDTLVRIAKAGKNNATAGFKLQSDLSNNADERADYWTQNHRLLDTAYVVAEFTIAEGDTTIPELDFVVRGKEIEQYNYDYSYRQHPNPTFTSGTITDKRALFKVGDSVDFYRLDNTGSNNGRLATDVQIVDATTYGNGRNEEIHKFRFSEDPLQSTDVREFYMVAKDAAYNSDSRYPMITWNYKSHSGTVPGNLYQTVTETVGDGNATIANTSTGGGTGVDFTELSAKIQAALAELGRSISIGLYSQGQTIADLVAEIIKAAANPSTAGGTTQDNDQGETQVNKEKVTTYALLNAIQLASNASSVNDYYNGQFLTLIQTDSDAVQTRQTRRIVDYDGTEKIAYLGSLVDVAANSTARSGSFAATQNSLTTNATTITLNTVANLSVGDVISAANEGTATIQTGTKITQINTGTKVITVDKPVRVVIGAVLTFQGSGGSDTQIIQAEDWDVIPTTGDKYEIYGEGDKKVSINPAIQLLDYLTNGRYGRGLEIYTKGSDTTEKDIDLESFKASARQCDTRSDVSIILPNATYADDAAWNAAVTNGHKWKYVSTVSSTDYNQWEGKIKSVSKNTDGTVLSSAGTGYVEVTFTDCIGKIVHRWFDWKSYDIGNAVYHRTGSGTSARNKVYLATAASTMAQPSSGNESSLAIQRTTDSSITANVYGVSAAGATETESGEQLNPVVKSWTGGSYEKSGYSIYDSDDVKYWRYLGWQGQDQREVTRHQTNSLIRTDTPLFDNVNSLLEHFNGILRYVGGKYQLDVESSTPAISTKSVTTTASYSGTQAASNSTSYTDPRIINDEDIIGAITVDDAGLKGSANTVSVSISDPNIRYDTRSVTFFKSEYLNEDRNIPKKKDVKTPLVTNFFNARVNAEQYLDQSRFNRKINFVIGPKGLLLLSGTIIKINYARFGWAEKEYRISNLSYRADCSVQITAYEHNDASYIVTPKQKPVGTRPAAAGPGDELVSPFPPNGLTATGSANSVTLNWTNTVGFGGGVDTGWATQIWVNNNISFNNQTADTEFADGAVLLHTTKHEESYVHKLPDITSDTVRYYWVRHTKEMQKVKNSKVKAAQVISVFNPTSDSNGVAATATAAAASSGIVYLYKSSVNEPTDDPTSDSLFPTLLVSLTGANAGKITGVKSGQGSAALTNNQVIDTNGDATGWFINPVNPTDNTHVVYICAATANSSGATDEILRSEWTDPPTKFTGAKGLNAATARLFQLNNNASSPTTARPDGDLTYTFSPPGIAGSNFNQWTTTAANTTSSNKYLWTITAAAVGAEDTDTIAQGDWSTAVIQANFAVDGVDGANGNPGATGDDAARTVTGYIYWIGSAATTPTNSNLPTNTTTYNFNTTLANATFNPALAAGSNNSTNWSISPPVASATRTTTFYAPFTAVETLSSGNQTGSGGVTFGDVAQGVSFTGLVTFQSLEDELQDASGTDITQIDGGKITTGFLKSPSTDVSNTDGSQFQASIGKTYFNLDNGAISSHTFRLQNNGTLALRGVNDGTGTGQGSITLNSNDQQILIKDAGATRVIIGKLP